MPSAEVTQTTITESPAAELNNTGNADDNNIVLTLPQTQDDRNSSRENRTEKSSANHSNNRNYTNNNGTVNNFPANQPQQPITEQFPTPYTGTEKNASAQNESPIQAEAKQNVNTFNKKNLIFSDTVLCLGNGLSVSYAGVQMPDAGTVAWGDGNEQAFAKINKHYYSKTGRYRVRIADGNKLIEKIIVVTEKPVASFSNFNCDKLQCKFRNNSSKAYMYVWNFGDGSPEVNTYHPEHHYGDTGKYTVQLKAYGTNGCVDSFLQQVRVTSYTKPKIYNVLTPNGDGDNDRFDVKIEDEIFYQIQITEAATNRVVFESKDKNNSWDGTLYNQGTPCKQGQYFYVITYKYGLLDPVREEKGMLTLLR
ncbi:MAG: hypothetical protein EOP53_01340 [Sphingobacteriales bacterium]|nr:MAG: hypothetical protein EOP53_01340 [Sphingobacteriales bacterium]